jgi:hypothetical protein
MPANSDVLEAFDAMVTEGESQNDPGPGSREWQRRRTVQLRRRRAAERHLREWAEVYRQRDKQVRSAVDAGLSVRDVHRVTGIARTTISRILAGMPAPTPDRASRQADPSP